MKLYHSHISDLTIEPKILSLPTSSTKGSSNEGSSTEGTSTEGSSSDDESMKVMYKTIKDACKIIQNKIELTKEEKKNMEIKKKNLLLDNECIICFEKMLCHQKMILPCKHYFHEECLKKWIDTLTNWNTNRRSRNRMGIPVHRRVYFAPVFEGQEGQWYEWTSSKKFELQD